jgi:hypothetical protein
VRLVYEAASAAANPAKRDAGAENYEGHVPDVRRRVVVSGTPVSALSGNRQTAPVRCAILDRFKKLSYSASAMLFERIL